MPGGISRRGAAPPGSARHRAPSAHVITATAGHADGPARMVLQLEPRNLLGAIWLQLAQAVSGNRDYRHNGGK